MIISDKYKFIHLHLPRTGGTSIYNFFKKLDPSVEYYSDKFNQETYHFGHIPANEVKELVGEEKWNSYFKFTFIRNPFDWVLSNYVHSSGQIFNLEEYWTEIWWIFGGDDIPKERLGKFYINKGGEIELDNFLKWHIFQKFYVGYKELLDQSSYLNIELDHIGLFENYDKELQYIGNKIGVDIKLDYKHNSTLNKEAYLSEEIKQIIPILYSNDIKLWEKIIKIIK